jgi:hypothetical protein
MNHDNGHFDDNEEALNCAVSDEELEAAACLSNPPAALQLTTAQNRRDC